MMDPEVKKTMLRMAVWCCIFAAAAACVSIIVLGGLSGWQWLHTTVLLGFIAGAGLGCFMAVHMAYSLSRAVLLGEAGALKYNRKMYLIRTSVIAAAIIAFSLTGAFNILALLGGLLCLKPAVYVQAFFRGSTEPAQDTETREPADPFEGIPEGQNPE